MLLTRCHRSSLCAAAVLELAQAVKSADPPNTHALSMRQ
jgi:hypothetical protein